MKIKSVLYPVMKKVSLCAWNCLSPGAEMINCCVHESVWQFERVFKVFLNRGVLVCSLIQGTWGTSGRRTAYRSPGPRLRLQTDRSLFIGLSSVLNGSGRQQATRWASAHLVGIVTTLYTSLVSCSGNVCLYFALTETPTWRPLVGFQTFDSVKTSTRVLVWTPARRQRSEATTQRCNATHRPLTAHVKKTYCSAH